MRWCAVLLKNAIALVAFESSNELLDNVMVYIGTKNIGPITHHCKMATQNNNFFWMEAGFIVCVCGVFLELRRQ